jgi:hypothetical protein
LVQDAAADVQDAVAGATGVVKEKIDDVHEKSNIIPTPESHKPGGLYSIFRKK